MMLDYQPKLTPALRAYDIQLIAVLDFDEPDDQLLWSTYQTTPMPDIRVEINGTSYAVVYAAQPVGFAAALYGLRPC
jgi:hypothetical protein